MARLGLLGRVMLILMAALAAVIVAALALGHYERRRAALPPIAPYPRIEQAAGIIDLLRSIEPDLRPKILRAVSDANLHATIAAAPPPGTDALRRAPRIEAVLRGYAGPGLGDDLRAYTDAARPERTRAGAITEGFLARVVWPMPDGQVLILDEGGPPRRLVLRLLGLPPGVWIGLLGIAVAGLALYTTQRELRPLRRLTAAAASFDGTLATGSAVAVEAGGAPDIRRLAQAVRSMQERVAALLQERSFLIGAISHDLKTYLTRLRLRAESIAAADARARTVTDLDAMTDLIDTALAFARGTTVAERRERVDLADLAAIEAAERDALGQPIACGTREAADALVAGDPVALRRVVANLVDNAQKFGRGWVAIGVDVASGLCRLSVEDDGPGVSEAERTAIFSPFYRLEGSRSRHTGGSGLGLAIARQIVEAHGGTLTVGEGSRGGARFVLALPRIARTG